MNFEKLTAEQQADIERYDTFLRGMISRLFALYKSAGPAQWEAFAKSSVDGPLKSLDPTAIVPNSTGFSGAKDMTAAEFVALQTMARGLVKLADDNLALIVKAIGVNGTKCGTDGRSIRCLGRPSNQRERCSCPSESSESSESSSESSESSESSSESSESSERQRNRRRSLR